MQIRDRVVEFRRIRASELRPHPQNWRMHPPAQQDALRGVLAEIGYAGALLARQLPDGSLELIDGHLRAETTPDAEVPVLVLDLDDREAAKLLALHDPLADMAEANHDVLANLLDHVETDNDAIAALLSKLLDQDCGAGCQPAMPELDDGEQATAPDVLPDAYQVVVDCGNESEQRTVFERLTGEGYSCKLLTL
ncbi:MAG: hypothetical protein LLG00_10510 [Planctomycetaceae bacterium]|nr:hypothetical protein [Planctomycetaceae bacterium]